MTAEAKVIKIKARADLLAKNYWIKIVSRNDRELRGKLNRLLILESRKIGAAPRATFDMLGYSWMKFKQDMNDLERLDEPGIYGMSYWINTFECQTDLEIGKECPKKGALKEEEFIKKFKEKYKLRDNCRIVFSDGSKQAGNISTGIGIVIHGEEIVCSISIDLRCSVWRSRKRWDMLSTRDGLMIC